MDFKIKNSLQLDRSINFIKRWWKKKPDLVECNFGTGLSQNQKHNDHTDHK